MKRIYDRFVQGSMRLQDLSLLLFRVILVIGFYTPAMNKIQNLPGVAEWFGSMNYPVPGVSAFLAMITESLGLILLALGLGTRVIAIPMMFVMVVAIFTVHISNGFSAADNGFEIPLYYFLMLFSLVAFGPGKISLDHLVGSARR